MASRFITEEEYTTKARAPTPVTTSSIVVRYVEAFHVRHLPKYLYSILSAALGKLSLKQTVDGQQRTEVDTVPATVCSFLTSTLGPWSNEFVSFYHGLGCVA